VRRRVRHGGELGGAWKLKVRILESLIPCRKGKQPLWFPLITDIAFYTSVQYARGSKLS
jgi:hypothetical protein